MAKTQKHIIRIVGDDIDGREITYTGTLAAAKRIATREFGEGFSSHRILVCNEFGDTIASRRVGASRWQDHET